MNYISTYPGTLVLPDGIEILSGAPITLSEGMAGNAGVAVWLEKGWLVDASTYRPAGQTSDDKAMRAERDELRAKVAAFETEKATAEAKAQAEADAKTAVRAKT